MATREESQRYAAELNERFEEFVRWAIQNWPNKNYPLLMSDFAASRREIGTILGPKLGEDDPEPQDLGKTVEPGYISTTPMPWP